MSAINTLKYLFLCVGLLMLAGAVTSWNNSRTFMATALTAQGEVIDLLPERSENDSLTYSPVVAFITAEGEHIEFTSSTSSYPPAYAPGEQVEVFYQQGKPQDAKLGGMFEQWGVVLIFGFMGLSFGAIGAGKLLVQRLKRSRREGLIRTGKAVTAKVESVAQKPRVKVNGRHPWVIHCQWHNPATGQVHLFIDARNPRQTPCGHALAACAGGLIKALDISARRRLCPAH
ncbi:DUF3592 domain-containing protein [Pseudomonas sp. KNUC1026]|uniref:DUF3592 domain-containing protein n=1 Tax=Pseudomonas sp. KNUC1026 TaxID=2893890 RepID=UPI001F244B3D|nr:DUF3592 domain-containing protein [Pseudomonas sp. KNUC1026]UFH50302.1 DUF3592 domain-containing protein [Pseudomonas sp. KNUC1026]